jgi:hypothetical protein
MRNILKTGTMFVAACLLAASPAFAAGAKACKAGEPTPESKTWNFDGEADELIDQTGRDALKIRQKAAAIQGYVMNQSFTTVPSWGNHHAQLSEMQFRANELSENVCRLTKIRQAVEPWRQQRIDDVTAQMNEVVLAAQSAVNSFNEWGSFSRISPDYVESVNETYNKAATLRQTVRHPVEGAASADSSS